MEGNVSS
ncbi:Protein of unknown function [Leuconostoc citreum]|nr:Protein of unknown function [Leuconostoc citreum]